MKGGAKTKKRSRMKGGARRRNRSRMRGGKRMRGGAAHTSRASHAGAAYTLYWK